MGGYGAREVAKMLGLSVAQVRSFVKAGFLDPARGLDALREKIPEVRLPSAPTQFA